MGQNNSLTAAITLPNHVRGWVTMPEYHDGSSERRCGMLEKPADARCRTPRSLGREEIEEKCRIPLTWKK